MGLFRRVGKSMMLAKRVGKQVLGMARMAGKGYKGIKGANEFVQKHTGVNVVGRAADMAGVSEGHRRRTMTAGEYAGRV